MVGISKLAGNLGAPAASPYDRHRRRPHRFAGPPSSFAALALLLASAWRARLTRIVEMLHLRQARRSAGSTESGRGDALGSPSAGGVRLSSKAASSAKRKDRHGWTPGKRRGEQAVGAFWVDWAGVKVPLTDRWCRQGHGVAGAGEIKRKFGARCARAIADARPLRFEHIGRC